MRHHKSQVRDPEATAGFLRSIAQQTGKEPGVAYAEAFRFLSFKTPRVMPEPPSQEAEV